MPKFRLIIDWFLFPDKIFKLNEFLDKMIEPTQVRYKICTLFRIQLLISIKTPTKNQKKISIGNKIFDEQTNRPSEIWEIVDKWILSHSMDYSIWLRENILIRTTKNTIQIDSWLLYGRENSKFIKQPRILMAVSGDIKVALFWNN